MPGVDGANTELMSVSIIAGPLAGSVIDKLGGDSRWVAVFEPRPHSQPEDVMVQLKAIAEKREAEHLLVRCDADRPAMAYAFLFADQLANVSRLTSVGFAIDSGTLLDVLLNRKAVSGSASLIAEQTEFVTHMFLDGAPNDPDFKLARSIANALNPRAKVIPLLSKDVAAWIERRDATFDFEEGLNGAAWRKLIDEEQSTATDDKVTTFGYCARRPFHPERFWALLQSGLTGVFRAKGFFWLATRMEEVGGLNLAGSDLQCASAGQWWAARDAQIREAEMSARSRKEWQEPFGDRRQSFAVMALGVDRDSLQRQLDGCLLTDEEMVRGEHSWHSLPDPFPSWSAQPTAHVHDHHHECDHDHGSHDHDCCG